MAGAERNVPISRPMVDRYQDLIAWQLAEAFKAEVIRLVQASEGARCDLRFRSQLVESARSVATNIVEGFLRFAPRYFANLLGVAAGSVGEAETHLRDGIKLGYFTEAECEPAFRLARRCLTATIRLKRSQSKLLK